MSKSKWIGGGVGWYFGGPIGGIIGFVIGSIIDKVGEDDTTQAHQQASQSQNVNAEQEFNVSLLILIACIIKADGKVVKSEIEFTKRFFVDLYGVEQAQEAMNLLKRMLQQPIDETAVAQQIHSHLNYSEKLNLLHMLFAVAFADGELHYNEQATIKRIAKTFHISDAEFNAIKAQFLDQKEEDWAYKILELNPRVTNDEIKTAFKKLAIKYHPDKVAHLGDEAKKIATEKFKVINDAYDSLKKERGFV